MKVVFWNFRVRNLGGKGREEGKYREGRERRKRMRRGGRGREEGRIQVVALSKVKVILYIILKNILGCFFCENFYKDFLSCSITLYIYIAYYY